MTTPDDETAEEHKKTLGERVREHLQAAEVAAEEAAGYGAATTVVEAAEAAVVPEHELGGNEDESRHAADGAEATPPP